VIGADILDKTSTNAFTFGRLREEPTWWELEEAQRIHFDEVQRLNQYLREEYHQLQVEPHRPRPCLVSGCPLEVWILEALRRHAGPAAPDEPAQGCLQGPRRADAE
jgi:hypothetical protein